jgi:hypothetical protein
MENGILDLTKKIGRQHADSSVKAQLVENADLMA